MLEDFTIVIRERERERVCWPTALNLILRGCSVLQTDYQSCSDIFILPYNLIFCWGPDNAFVNSWTFHDDINYVNCNKNVKQLILWPIQINIRCCHKRLLSHVISFLVIFKRNNNMILRVKQTNEAVYCSRPSGIGHAPPFSLPEIEKEIVKYR